MATQTPGTNLSQFNSLLEEYLVKKAPALPLNIKETIVKFGPWITVIVMLVTLPALLALFGLGMFLTPFSYLAGPTWGFSYTVSMVLLLVTLVMELIALPGLFNRKKSGWNLVYYSTLINAVHSLVNLQIVSMVIGTLISLYILFQVKNYYK